jgi:hypothetical protein
LSLNVAVTVVAPVTIVVQAVPSTLVHPVHDENDPVADADATNYTVIPGMTSAEQVAPQLMSTPVVVDRTMPVPLGPLVVTERRKDPPIELSGRDALTSEAASLPSLRSSEQRPLELHV